MSQQNYSNHRKFYPPHHFVLLPGLAAASFIGFYKWGVSDNEGISWLLFAISSVLTLYAVIMMRQHYALGNQDRIIRLEFRVRYMELYGRPAKEIEEQLTFAQIAALRFASDSEFKTLLQRTINSNLSATDIKKAITKWQADDMRV